MSTPSASPCARAGCTAPAIPTLPITDAHPTNTNIAVANSSTRQGCTYCSYTHLFLLVLLVPLPAAGSPVSATSKASDLGSVPDMLTQTLSAVCQDFLFHRWTTVLQMRRHAFVFCFLIWGPTFMQLCILPRVLGSTGEAHKIISMGLLQRTSTYR